MTALVVIVIALAVILLAVVSVARAKVRRDVARTAVVAYFDAIIGAEDALRAQLDAANERIKALEETVSYHPRAFKLMSKQKNFVVVAQDETYFVAVYSLIRDNEKLFGTWTEIDEELYLRAIRQVPSAS